MNELATLQDQFQDYLITGNEALFSPKVVNDNKVGNLTRMRVYFEAYRLRLHEILSDDYSKTLALMGEQDFQKAFLLYLDSYPSHHFSARYFGRWFNRFLAQSPLYQTCPWLAEMATFEALLANTLDAADAPILPPNFLQTLAPDAWGECQLALHPSVQFNTFEFNVPKLWMELDSHKAPSEIAKIPAELWIFWRKGIKSAFMSCNYLQTLILSGLVQQLTIAEICEQCLPFLETSEIIQGVATTLQNWLAQGLLCHSTVEKPLL